MAPTADENEIVDLTHLSAAARPPKPVMRVEPGMFQPSTLGQSLPGFLERMARANQELATANAGGFELTEEEAASQQHIEMNLYAGIMEKDRKKRQADGVKLPTHGSDEDEDADSTSMDDDTSDSASQDSRASADDSTRSKKRKALPSSAPSEASRPPKIIRLRVSQSPPGTPITSAQSFQKIKIVKSPPRNGARPSVIRLTSSSSSDSDTLSDGSSSTKSRILKIKVPSKSPSPDNAARPASSSSSSTTSSRSRIIKLRDPRSTPSPPRVETTSSA